MQCLEDPERDNVLKERKGDYGAFIGQLVRTANVRVRRALVGMDRAKLCLPCLGRSVFDMLTLECIIAQVREKRPPTNIHNIEPIDPIRAEYPMGPPEHFEQLCTHIRREQSYSLFSWIRTSSGGKVMRKEVVALFNFARNLYRPSTSSDESPSRFFQIDQVFSEDMFEHRENRAVPGRGMELVLETKNLEELSTLLRFVPKNMLPRKRDRNPDDDRNSDDDYDPAE